VADPVAHGSWAHLARALSASACEPLVVEQVETADRLTARAHLARRRELEQQRTRAQQRLGEAQEKLDRLGWRGRGRRGDKLRSEFAATYGPTRRRQGTSRTHPRTDVSTLPPRPDHALARDRSLQRRPARDALEQTSLTRT